MKRWMLFVLFLLFITISLEYQMNTKEKTPHAPLSLTDALGGNDEDAFPHVLKPRPFQFPADHGPHTGFKTEWWYFTGNLHTSAGRRFGYQLTFFRFALKSNPIARDSLWAANDIFMAHFTITDVEAQKFHPTERFSRAAIGLAGAEGIPLKIHLEDWSAAALPRDNFAMVINAASGDEAIKLHVQAKGPVMVNGDRGLSRKGSKRGNASYYYSIPRLETTGTIKVAGKEYGVTGNSWLDHEWGTTALEPDQSGWDWFGLQLSQDRALMFYRLRKKDGSTDRFSGGTLLKTDGTFLPLQAEDVKIEVTDWWHSMSTNSSYPARWRLKLPKEKLSLEIVPVLTDQELAKTAIHYWEGAVSVRDAASGDTIGEGYTELTGYGDATSLKR